jgi:hypothetical protein
MAIKQDVNVLLMKKMDRKEFLKHVGVGIIAMTGIAAILRSVSSEFGGSKATSATSYGGSVYGGGAKNV